MIWETSDGRNLYVHEMDLAHKFNTLRWLERNSQFLLQVSDFGYTCQLPVTWIKTTPIYQAIAAEVPEGVEPFVRVRNALYDAINN